MEAIQFDTASLTPSQENYVREESFDVMDAFSKLDTTRKMALFDQLMCGRANAYRNTLKNIWPQSNDHDARKLEIVLRARLDRLKKFS